MKAFIIIAVVVLAVFGLLLTLRSTRNVGTPSGDVLERAQKRAQAQAAEEKRDE